MSEKKSITIDTKMLLGGSNSMNKSKRKSSKTSGSGERKIRPNSIVQPSTLKKTLLERIKQHQRTRERSRDQRHNNDDNDHEHNRENDKTSSLSNNTSSNPAETSNDNFTQSIDFLRKLALKRRQQMTQKRAHSETGSFGSSNSSSSSSIGGLPEAKTPEAKMLNQVAQTLQHGEILTNTGLLGLPVVNTIVQPHLNSLSSAGSTITDAVNHVAPMISLGPMPMPVSVPAATTYSNAPMSFTTSNFDTVSPSIPTSPISEPPKLTQLAEMYNNTIAAASEVPVSTETKEDAPLHIPTKPEDYLPSIFIKEEPPHGCLKNGKKPTFREWATNILKKPVDTVKNMIGGETVTNDHEMSNAQIGGSGEGQEIQRTQELNSLSNSVSNINPEQVAGMRVKIRKTHKKRFRIGKHDDVVGVLLKNKQTQRHIQSQHLTLKQKTIGEIRKYLYDHHLLKIGSNAPPDVLRRMYEDAILTGDVKNTNKDVLLHNFMSGGGDHE